MSVKNSKLLKKLVWGTNFTVALDDEWDVIEHPELPLKPYMKEDHTNELLVRNPDFNHYLQLLFGENTKNLFVDIPAHITLETFHDYIDSLT